MTCHDVRDRLSLLMDEALALPERAAVDAHLATCAECRRELEQLRATVALLDRLPPARAPAGFVDRVMAEAYRPSWPRRALDALFVPLRVKLPLEAAAVLLVGVSALYVYQRTPEVRELARQEAPAPSPAAPLEGTPSTRPAPESAPEPARPADAVREAERAREQEAASETKRQRAPTRELAPERQLAKKAPAREETGQARSVPPAPSAPPARPDDFHAALSAKKEAQVEPRADAPGTAPPAGSERDPQPAEPPAARDTAGAGARAAAPATAPPAPPAGKPAQEAEGRVGGAASAPTAPPATERPFGQETSRTKSRDARLMRTVDASGRLTVSARAPAERALDALLARLGGARVGRLLEGDRGLIVIDVLVPGARYPELIDGLGRIGRWVTEYESATLPAQVRVEVALTVEP
jgi:hypothetical protein